MTSESNNQAGRIASSAILPVIFVIHPREKRSKCSIEPLRGRHGFVFWKFPQRGPESLERYVRIGIGGPQLGPDDVESGLLILDGTWKLAERMEKSFAEVPVRSLPAWSTAYPRVSKLFEDPSQGLATIEALFIAHAVLGREAMTLLDWYPWKNEFLARNEDQIRALPHRLK